MKKLLPSLSIFIIAACIICGCDDSGSKKNTGLFVAVGVSGQAWKSSDAVTWTDVSPEGEWLRGVTCGNDLFVAVGNNSQVWYSEDATDWTDATPSGTAQQLNGIAYGNGRFTFVGNRSMYSTDGVSWTDTNPGTTINDIIYADNMFVIVGNSGYTAWSTDATGDSWTEPTTLTDPIYSIGYGNGLFVAMGASGNVWYSSDAGKTDTWTKITIGEGTPTHQGIAYGNGRFVAVGSSKPFYSDDGTTWTQSASGSGGMNDVVYGNGRFVAVGTSGTILWSTDGGENDSWHTVSPGGNELSSIAYKP